MLNRLPTRTHDLVELLRSIGDPPDREVAKVFGVTARTVRRWKKHGAPRPVLFSLWWLSPAGQRALAVEMHNALQLQEGLARAYRRDVERLQGLVNHLCSIGDFGCANDPGLRAAARPLARPFGPVAIHLRGEACGPSPASGADSPPLGCAPALRAPAVGLE